MASTQHQTKASRKRTTGRRAARTTRPAAKPNPFDDIARQVNADQEARDRAVGRDDLKGKATMPVVTVRRGWSGPVPRGMPELKGASLVTRYEVRPDDGTVWSTLSRVLGPDGRPLEDFWRLPLDFRPHPQLFGNRRKVVLKDRTREGLQAWLDKAGLAGS